MFSLLLPIIYLAFISLGLPDPLLGAAWPNMYPALGVPVSFAGILSTIIAANTVVSSLLCERVQRRFGTGKVVFFSVLLTAAALFGFSVSGSFWMLCVCAVPYGLGAGSVDAVLNNYVALHYKARHMSWLHCMWGVGCSIGPVVMSSALSAGTWQAGYRAVSILQAVLTAILLFSLPLWKDGARPADGGAEKRENATAPAPRRSMASLLKLPGVPDVMGLFFCYCALESTAGMWAASYCTLARGIPAEQAAAWASLFFLGVTAGRFVSGFVTFRVNDRNMIRLGQGVALCGVLLVLLSRTNALLLIGLVTVGVGCAPIYPSVIHETPQNFGAENSQGVIGIQMASAYVGTTLIPLLFGWCAERISFALYPWFLGLFLLLMTVASEMLHKKTAALRQPAGNA